MHLYDDVSVCLSVEGGWCSSITAGSGRENICATAIKIINKKEKCSVGEVLICRCLRRPPGGT